MKRALVIVDHGSRRPEAHAQLERIGASVRELAPELDVRIAHLELASPSLGEAIAACAKAGAEEVSVHPLFLAWGRHLAEDIPARIAEAEGALRGVRIRLLAPLGDRPELAGLILKGLSSPE